MVQGDIKELLVKRKGEPISLPDLCIILARKANRKNVSRACKQMRKRGEIEVTPVKSGPFTKHLISLPN